ncbi:hypothetical protein HE1_00600 [Holospora elegans E1]|uniref:Uncharacterized protein n=1 Tax=Holospora elegans E1 TaxID=1427503 RepID=A0A023DXU9_9PROT|nr:hypothetical protein [Holospora elegans]GAJ46273.1 hypothetical protein HE1_00600 [Holospora elegans E1]
MIIKIFLSLMAVVFAGFESLKAEPQQKKSYTTSDDSLISELDTMIQKLENFINLKNKQQLLLEKEIQGLKIELEEIGDLFSHILEKQEVCTDYTEKLETQLEKEQSKNSTEIHKIQEIKTKTEKEKEKLVHLLDQYKKKCEESLEKQKKIFKDSFENIRFSSENFERFSKIADRYHQSKVELEKYTDLIKAEFPGFEYNPKKTKTLYSQLQEWKNNKPLR